MVKRRTLISYAGLSTAIALITGIFGRETSQAQTKPIKIGSLKQLEAKGSLTGKTPKGPVVVVAHGDSVSAVNPTCPHEGCQVRWQDKDHKFICPCHSAQFSAMGQVMKGPAKRNLTTYKTQVQGDTVSILV